MARTRALCVFPALLLAVAACGSDRDRRGDGGRPPVIDGGPGRVDGGPGGVDGGPGGGAAIGDPCTSDADCTEPPDAVCFTTVGGGPAPTIDFPNGYCSKACDPEGDATEQCGTEAGCASSSMSGGGGGVSFQFCASMCMTDADCRAAEGYRCNVILAGLPGWCAPG